MLFLGLLFGVTIVMGIILLIYGNKTVEPKQISVPEKTTFIRNVFPTENIFKGVIRNAQYLLLAKIEGVNISVMSDIEQNARESALINIFLRLDFPIRFITNTAIVDTSVEAWRIVAMADNSSNDNLKTYRILYAGALEQMRVDRSVLTQQTILAIPGASEEEARERLNILSSSLSEQTSIIVTPLSSTEAVFDVLQDILTPEKIIKPSEVAAAGVLEPVHFSGKEVFHLVQEAAQS